MIKALLLLSLISFSVSEKQPQKYTDPFAALDQHISHSLAYHYLWPWSQLMKAAAAFDEDIFDEPQIVSTPEKMTVNMNVRRFKPDELRIRVKNRNIVVEGKRKMDSDNKFMANHFVQRFVLPPGSKQEEVKAVLKDNVLTVSVPRHDVPPPPPEIDVPIEVIQTIKEEIPEKKTDKPKKPTEITKPTEEPTKPTEITVKVTEKAPEVTEKKVESPVTSSPTIEQLDLVEATTHVGKIRKKELKETKTNKDNEVTKGVDQNGLDYALIDSE